MKKILLLSVVLCTLFVAQAQRVYFVYLQSENRTPFYVKMGDKVYSSSAEGYLIVPKLVDSTYSFVIGKINRSVPEGRFAIPINTKDRGFLIREADNKLSLFDFQSMGVIEATHGSSAGVSYIRKTDSFSKLLAQAADDTTLLNVPVMAQQNKPKQEAVVAKAPVVEAVKPELPAIKTDTAVNTTNATASAPAGTVEVDSASSTADAVQGSTSDSSKVGEAVAATTEQAEAVPPAVSQEEAEFKRSIVTRRSESSTSEGFGLVFLDTNEQVTDTIRILIPNPKMIFGNVTAVPPAEDKQFLSVGAISATVDTVAVKPVEVAAAAPASACAASASENDLSRLRKSMASKSSEELMVEEAKKQFTTRCFTTEQVRELSTLILTPKGKFTFFSAAYPHVSDQERFAVLETELKADYFYMNRFKALIAK